MDVGGDRRRSSAQRRAWELDQHGPDRVLHEQAPAPPAPVVPVVLAADAQDVAQRLAPRRPWVRATDLRTAQHHQQMHELPAQMAAHLADARVVRPARSRDRRAGAAPTPDTRSRARRASAMLPHGRPLSSMNQGVPSAAAQELEHEHAPPADVGEHALGRRGEIPVDRDRDACARARAPGLAMRTRRWALSAISPSGPARPNSPSPTPGMKGWASSGSAPFHARRRRLELRRVAAHVRLRPGEPAVARRIG